MTEPVGCQPVEERHSFGWNFATLTLLSLLVHWYGWPKSLFDNVFNQFLPALVRHKDIRLSFGGKPGFSIDFQHCFENTNFGEFDLTP